MEECNYINNHLFKLSKIERDTFTYFKYHFQKVPCVSCQDPKNVIYVVKNTKSRTMKNVGGISGIIKCNPYNNRIKPNDHYYCKKCNIYF